MTEWMSVLQPLTQLQKAETPARCNALSAPYGLTLTSKDMQELAQNRAEALLCSGRVEFGAGVLEKLVAAFCSSPHIEPADWTECLCALQELFYFFKSECREQVTDDELIEALRLLYNGPAQGSTEYISGISRRTMCRIARTGSLEGLFGEIGYGVQE